MADIYEIAPGVLAAMQDVEAQTVEPLNGAADMLRDFAAAAERGEVAAVAVIAVLAGADKPTVATHIKGSPYLILAGAAVVEQMAHEDIADDMNSQISFYPPQDGA